MSKYSPGEPLKVYIPGRYEELCKPTTIVNFNELSEEIYNSYGPNGDPEGMIKTKLVDFFKSKGYKIEFDTCVTVLRNEVTDSVIAVRLCQNYCCDVSKELYDSIMTSIKRDPDVEWTEDICYDDLPGGQWKDFISFLCDKEDTYNMQEVFELFLEIKKEISLTDPNYLGEKE